jgi:hypothetical protein
MELLLELRRVLDAVYTRISTFLHTVPPGAVQVTGVLGLAALLIGYYHLRGNNNNNSNNRSSAAAGSSRSSGPAASGTSQQQASSSAAAAKPASAAMTAPELQGLSSTARAVRTHLAGVRRVTISAPGVLLDQTTPEELQDSATLRPGVEELLKEVASCADVYVIAHVEDDVGQAAVQGVMDAAGLVGAKVGCIKQHKILFCSTAEGKISMVRQLEPDLHIDAAAPTVQELKRFMPQLLHVTCGGAMAATGAPNVGHAASLAAFFGLK